MLPLSADELAAIQTDAAAVLDLTCVVERKTLTPDGQGGASESWNTVTTVKVGTAEPSAGQLQNYASRIGSLSVSQIRFPVGTDIRHQDRLTISGQQLIVQVVLNPRSYPGLLTALVSEVK